MKGTLNLRFDKATIEAAKVYAARENTSISEIVETYLKKLVAINEKKEYQSDNLIGILKKYKEMSDEEIRSIYLKEKHHA